MPSQEVLYEVADRVATITLNRPDKLNAWTAVMEHEVRSAIEDAERDDRGPRNRADRRRPRILRGRRYVTAQRRGRSGP